MPSKTKVFLSSGNYQKWAIGDDLALTRMALKDTVELTSLELCEVAHFTWWEGILNYDIKKLIGKRILCQMTGEPLRYMKLPRFQNIIKIVGKWIAQSKQAEQQLTDLKLSNVLIPYVVNTDIFRPTNNTQEVIEKWKIPQDAYIISNFHRDTEGNDLVSPKLVKGPDIFLETICKVAKKNHIHVLLAGPRRFWLKDKLTRNNVGFTYIGKNIRGDDMDENVLPQELINKLYSISDLYIISSRSEGGPRTLIESTAAKCKVISTPVGLAMDVLSEKSIYKTVDEAVEIIDKDIRDNFLVDTIDPQYYRTIQNNTILSSSQSFQKMYNNIDKVPIFRG